MTDPVALLSEYVRIDTSNPPGDSRRAAELLCGALRAGRGGILGGKLFRVANADEEVGGVEGAEYFVRNLPFPIGAAYGMNEGGVGGTGIFGGGGTRVPP